MNTLLLPFPQAAIATGPTSCAVAFRAAGAVASGGANVTPALPAGWQLNDVCLCLAYSTVGDAVTISAGWTQVFQSGNFTIWYRRMAAGDTAPTISGSTDKVLAQIIAWSGCKTTGNPIGAASASFSQNDSSGDNVACNQITTANAYSKVVMVVGCFKGASSPAYSSTTWSAWALGANTPTKENWGYYTTSPYVGFCVADYAQAAAGATGTASATSSNLPYGDMSAALVELISASDPTQCNISFVGLGAVGGTNSGTTTNNIAPPAGWQVSDVGIIINYNASGDAVTTPSGWTQIFQSGNYTAFYRRLLAGDTQYQPVIGGITAGHQDVAVQFCFRGCKTVGAPIGAASTGFGQTASSGDNVACSGITTLNAFAKVALAVLDRGTNASSTTWSNWALGTNTPAQEATGHNESYGNTGIAVADYGQNAAGATGAASATSSNVPYGNLAAALFELITS